MDNLKTTVFLEHLKTAKEKILLHLKGKISKIKYLYDRPEITAAQVKQINAEHEHVRQVLAYLDDAENTIKAIQEENQNLRIRAGVFYESAAFWKNEYHKEQETHLATITSFQRFAERQKAAA